MAEFLVAFDKTLQNEGGFELHTVAGDTGGQTYAGIARNFHPNWDGWQVIDARRLEDPELTRLVEAFYRVEFWSRMRGDDIDAQDTASSIFDFSVNAGVRTAVKLAQVVSGATPDGIAGNRTVKALNRMEAESFVLKYTLSKVARYAEICRRHPARRKFLLGWINRTLGGIS